MKVLWLANIPSPYRVKFFTELGKACDLTVLFEKRVSAERDESWKEFNTDNFNAIFLKGKNIGTAEAFCPSVIQYLNRSYDHIVVTTFSDLTGILAILYMKIKKIPYEIESDGAFPGTGKGNKENIKKFLLSGAVRYFSTAKIHDEYYKLYGAKEERIVRYPFSSIGAKEVLKTPISSEEKKNIRKSLGVTEEHMVLAVGQFIYRKGYDILIRAAARLNNSFGIYIVGGQIPTEYKLLVEQLNLHNIYFINFQLPEELKKYYTAADIFVHPTREDIWGLVINEAMANGLPVVTTDRCIAGLEMVEVGKTGKIIPVGKVEELADAIQSCVVDERLDSKCVLATAKKYTFESMVRCHMNVWNV